MKIQPRQELLEIWRAMARASFQKGEWVWGGRDLANSISDAEQLLCLLAPATEVVAFRLDRPDETADDVLTHLRALGDSVEIPRLIIHVVREYLERYTDETGTPTFSGDSYFVSPDGGGAPTAQQRALQVVDSFSMSVTLMLATIGFGRVFRTVVRRDDILRDLAELEALASERLSAAMVGLLRSFTANVFDADSPEGRILCRTVNQTGLSERQILEALRIALRETSANLRALTIGSGQVTDLDNPNLLFECGWSWGIVKDAPVIETSEVVGQQRDGVAQPAPYLYFTVVALDAIEDLVSERTRLLGLLNEEQQRLARSLQIRWDIAQSYWSTIATFGDGRWPLEDIPWRTTDGVESDYLSLLVSSVAVQGLVRNRPREDLSRVGDVLDELAHRARITRRPFEFDPAVAMHAPGQEFDLVGSETADGPPLYWVVSDLAPLLLKRTMRVAALVPSIEQRGKLSNLADAAWEHLAKRRLTDGAAHGLWDQPAGAFPQVTKRHAQPSWYFTERVVQCLITAAGVISGRPLGSDQLTGYATDLLSEADHLYDQELLSGSTEAGPSMREVLRQVEANLRRARTIVHDRPGTAATLASEALRELDRLAVARQDTPGVI
jgi:hypothetical protein